MKQTEIFDFIIKEMDKKAIQGICGIESPTVLLYVDIVEILKGALNETD